MSKPTDPLTGLIAGTEVNPSMDALVESNTLFALVLLDIDHLLALNRDFGHEAGDWVFRLIAAHIKELFQTPSMGFRVGGDAFAIVMPEKNKETAFLVAEDLRRRVCEAQHTPHLNQSVSIGIASFPEDGSRTADIYRRADGAMIRAKKEDRNCVRLAREEKLTPKTSHYTQAQLEQLSEISEKISVGEAALLREALDDLLRKYDE